MTHCCRGRWSPAHAPLGWLLRRLYADERQAEAWYLIWASSTIAGLILLQFLVWSLLHAGIEADRMMALWFWVGQCTGLALVLVLLFAGRKPGVCVRVGAHKLRVRQGRRAAEVPLQGIAEYQVVPALQFHRNHAPYDDVDAFVSRLQIEVLMLRAEGRWIAVSFASDIHRKLCAYIDAHDL